VFVNYVRAAVEAAAAEALDDEEYDDTTGSTTAVKRDARLAAVAVRVCLSPPPPQRSVSILLLSSQPMDGTRPSPLRGQLWTARVCRADYHWVVRDIIKLLQGLTGSAPHGHLMKIKCVFRWWRGITRGRRRRR